MKPTATVAIAGADANVDADIAQGGISLIVLAFNHARYLPELFASIERNLDDIAELLFIDNGSSDDSAQRMRDFLDACDGRAAVRMFANARGTGVTSAVNAALRAARGAFVAVSAADDYLLDHRFTAQVSAMRADANVAFCYSNGYVCDETGVMSPTPVHGGDTVALLTRTPAQIARRLFYPVPTLFTQCALFRRSALLEVGGWDEDLVIDDWPLNLKLFSRFAAGYRWIPGFVCAYRRHDTNASRRRFRQYMGQKRVLQKYARDGDLVRGLFALYAAQALASIKRLQRHRIGVFARAALGQKPGAGFIIQWTLHEIRRRVASDRIR